MPETKKQQTQAEILVNHASQLPLFHTAEGEVYAKIPVANHYEVWAVRSKGFRRWLSGLFFELVGKPPSAQAMNDALGTMEGLGQFSFPEEEVHVRLAWHDEKIYLDLVNGGWEAVEISKYGWNVIQNPPVNFRRPKGLLPLPYPDPKGDIKELRTFLNLPQGDEGEVIWKLILGWLVQVGRPQGPYPILVLHGEQGSAKSTVSRILRAIVDPSTVPLRTSPRSERDLAITASHNWVLAFDNISFIKNWLSDAICRLSTGGGFSTRELYTNDDECLFSSTRPIILNGIDEMVTRHDLADRCIFLTLPPISDDRRMTEKDLMKRLNRASGQILGGLLNIISTALRNIETTTLSQVPRMADFALWVQAAEPCLPWKENSFMTAYIHNRRDVIELALDADQVATAARQLMESRNIWEGTASELLEKLEEGMSEKEMRRKVWPKSPASLSKKLKRAASFLRRSGIVVDFHHVEAGRRIITLERIQEENTVTTVTEKPQQSRTDNGNDGNDGRKHIVSDSPSSHKPTSASCGGCDHIIVSPGILRCNLADQKPLRELDLCPLYSG